MSGFSFTRRTLLVGVLASSLALGLAACSNKPEFQGTDISDSGIGRDMQMVDIDGNTRTVADYKGKVVVVFFGFTHCPDVCPTAMAQLGHAMQILQNDAKQVQVIMVTVDPERDTPAILRNYVKAFDPSFTALTGTSEQLAQTARSFRAFYSKVPGQTPEQYTMNHASSFYLLDQTGEARVLLRGDAVGEVIAHDIRQLL